MPRRHQVTARKKNSDSRRTVGMQVIFKHVVRETHITQSPFHHATLVPPGTDKLVTDAWNGYHSVQTLIMFTTHVTGSVPIQNLSRGFTASRDGYTRTLDEIANDFPNHNQIHRSPMPMCRRRLSKKISFKYVAG